MLERAFAGDPAFLARRSGELARELAAERTNLVRLLLAEGAAREARRVLAEWANAPRPLALLARLPGPLVAGAARGRRAVRRVASLLPWLPWLG